MNEQNDTGKTKNEATYDGETVSGDTVVSEAVPKYKPKDGGLPFEEGKLYTYSDMLEWPDEINGIPVCYELIDGVPFVMQSAGTKHQGMSGELFGQLYMFLRDKPCKVFYELNARLNADAADNTFLIPDIIVVCDHSKLVESGCKGAPDFIIEILSPSTAQRDRLVKLQQYEKYGVREYWIVDPEAKSLTVYILKDGKYELSTYDGTATVPVYVLKGCEIDLSRVFA